jgi:hypothetical protein
MEDLQESLLNLSVEMIQNLHESSYAKQSKTVLHSVPSTKENSEYRIAEEFSFDKNLHTSMKRRKAILFNVNSLLSNIWLKDI